MASIDLEQRVAILEAELAKLKARLGIAGTQQFPWRNGIAGIFDDDGFEEATSQGR